MIAGTAQDTAELVDAVIALVDGLGCRQCLLWCKADEVILRLHQQRPGSLLGYVSLPEDPEQGPSMAPFRLGFPQVGLLTGLCAAAARLDSAVDACAYMHQVALQLLHCERLHAHAFNVRSLMPGRQTG